MTQYAQKPEDDLQGSAYLRMFGNEMKYIDFKDMKTKKGQEFNILDFLIKLAQEHKIDMSRSYMFLDSTVTVPTAAGLPLKLAVNGTATVRMQIEGKMDLRKLGTSPRSVDIDGSIKPRLVLLFALKNGKIPSHLFVPWGRIYHTQVESATQ